MVQIAIIGGGVVGCAAARSLTRYQIGVTVFEKASDVACGTSKANTGIVHSGHDAEPGSLKALYNRLGNQMYPQLCEELSVPYKNNGTLVLAFSDEDMAQVAGLVGRAAVNGIPGVRAIGREELLAMEPNVNPEAIGALFAPTGGIVSPYELTIALAENAAHNGARFELNCPVTGLCRADGGFALTAGGREYRFDAVINCAGLYADEINNMLCEKKYHITPRRGEYVILDRRNEGAVKAAIFQLPRKLATGHTKGIVIAPTVEGTIMLGPTADDVGDKEATENTAAGFRQVLEGAALSWPDYPRGDIISGFAGLRAHSDTGDFVVGESEVRNFYNCLGIESPGLTSAPAIGEHIAGLLAERFSLERNGSFDPRRPLAKPFRDMSDEERAAAIAVDPDYGRIVCRCETVTEAEIRRAIHAPVGARTLDAVKRRTRAGMGRCQSGFCSTRVIEILSEELGISPLAVTKDGAGSELMFSSIFEEESK